MARKRRKDLPQLRGNWLTTYGDMVTLLLTFFVFLYSFSTIDVQKFQKMIYSFQDAIGVLPGVLRRYLARRRCRGHSLQVRGRK